MSKQIKFYTAINGDTWDSIAFKCYGDEFLCDALCAANSRKHEGVIVFGGGERVAIPEKLSIKTSVIKAPWGK